MLPWASTPATYHRRSRRRPPAGEAVELIGACPVLVRQRRGPAEGVNVSGGIRSPVSFSRREANRRGRPSWQSAIVPAQAPLDPVNALPFSRLPLRLLPLSSQLPPSRTVHRCSLLSLSENFASSFCRDAQVEAGHVRLIVFGVATFPCLPQIIVKNVGRRPALLRWSALRGNLTPSLMHFVVRSSHPSISPSLSLLLFPYVSISEIRR